MRSRLKYDALHVLLVDSTNDETRLGDDQYRILVTSAATSSSLPAMNGLSTVRGATVDLKRSTKQVWNTLARLTYFAPGDSRMHTDRAQSKVVVTRHIENEVEITSLVLRSNSTGAPVTELCPVMDQTENKETLENTIQFDPFVLDRLRSQSSQAGSANRHSRRTLPPSQRSCGTASSLP
jgi:hypothetical protein